MSSPSLSQEHSHGDRQNGSFAVNAHSRRRALGRRTTIEEIHLIAQHHTSTLEISSMGDNNEGDDTIDDASISSLSTVEDLLDEDPLLVAVQDSLNPDEDWEEPKEEPIIVKFKQTREMKTLDVAKYMADREMTPLQERMNAITMIPSPVYCFYFIVASQWLSQSLMDEYRDVDQLAVDESLCISSSWFPQLYAMPPLTILATTIGITLHAPFSFMYHWKYASTLPPGFPRTNHWSRRLDQSFIHVCSAFMAYGTSGSWDYFLANVLFAADCIYRQFKRKVRPRRNQIRIGLSILAYTFPILRHGDVALFSKCWLVLFVGGWFFVKYPFGGWSHSAFHIIVALLPPLLMVAACNLQSSQEQMRVAAQCALLAERAVN